MDCCTVCTAVRDPQRVNPTVSPDSSSRVDYANVCAPLGPFTKFCQVIIVLFLKLPIPTKLMTSHLVLGVLLISKL